MVRSAEPGDQLKQARLAGSGGTEHDSAFFAESELDIQVELVMEPSGQLDLQRGRDRVGQVQDRRSLGRIDHWTTISAVMERAEIQKVKRAAFAA